LRQRIDPAGQRGPRNASWLLLTILALFLTGRQVAAQQGGGNQATTTSQTPQAAATDTGTPTADSQNNGNTQNAAQQASTTTGDTASKTTDKATSATLPNLSSSTSPANLPQLTSSAPLPNLSTALPKITQNTANIPTYQVVIPQLDGNPFLQTSSLPEGTVFIVVGSCLAGLAVVLMLSRTIYIWYLHRQSRQRGKDIKYSEMEQRPYAGGATAASSNPFAGISGGGSISLEYLRAGDQSSRLSTYSSRPSTARPQTNGTLRPTSSANLLSSSNIQFYSPSAYPGSTAAMALGTQPGSRDSGYLPAGYYLREPSTANNQDSSPKQMYIAPTQSAPSYLYSEPSATPIPHLSRSPISNTVAPPGGNGRPSTGGGSPPSRGGNGGGYSGQTSNTQARGPTSSRGRDAMGENRGSRPSQVLDELLGGR